MQPSRDISRLIEIMVALHRPGTGCGWDIAQTFETIVPYTIEEAYEIADAVARIHDLEKRIARQRANLANLDATIKLFSPGANPDAIHPKRVYRRTRYFAHNDLSRLTQDGLADSIGAAHVGRNSRRRHAGEGNVFRRCGDQGDCREQGADGVAASCEARDRDKARHKPRWSMGASASVRGRE
jgi:hypothetical protein